MNSRPFFARLLLAFAALLGLIVAVSGGVMYWAAQRTLRDQQVADLERLIPLTREWLGVGAGGGDTPDERTQARLRDAARLLNTRVTVVAGDGRVTFDTLVGLEKLNNHNDRPEVVAARAGVPAHSVRPSASLGEEAVYVAELLDPKRPDGPVIRFSYPQRTWIAFRVPVWPVLGGSVLAAVLTVGGLAWTLQRRWIGPTHRLVATADRLAAGEWHARAEPGGADELQFFSTRLNQVASHAQRQLADLRDQRADLQALVDTLPDPVLATDDAGRVILINLPAARLLALARSRALGQTVVNVVNDVAVLDLFDRARSNAAGPPAPAADPRELPLPPGENAHGRPFETPEEVARLDADPGPPPLTREIRLNRDGQWLTFQAVAKRTAGGGVLLVLRDVTALASAVQMKTDFVANASHELRTPIAAIKIAFETLREVYGDDAHQSDRCMQVIEGHLRRLEEMLRDLLDLSRVENPNLKPHVRTLKTADVLAHVRSALGPMARQKLVELRLGEGLAPDAGPPAESPTEFLGDERLLNLILKNLIENSVKFTPAGGTVSVTFTRAAGGRGGEGGAPAPVTLTVADTGIGIPPEHMDRVFERFYQVDAARSGSAGRGTGLGLAIVKHAINALGGQVELESEVGHGTTVRCVLPQVQPEPAAEVEEVGV